MKIFEVSGDIENRIVTPTEEILLIFPFDEIWDRDDHPRKDMALREYAYIEFMVSPKDTNPFIGYPEKERKLKIFQNKFERAYPNWRPDELIRQAIDIYKEFIYKASPTYSYYEASLAAANNMKEFFKTVNLQDRNSRDMPLYKPKEITSALIDTEKVITNLNAMKEKVIQEISDITKTKGNRSINHFER